MLQVHGRYRSRDGVTFTEIASLGSGFRGFKSDRRIVLLMYCFLCFLSHLSYSFEVDVDILVSAESGKVPEPYVWARDDSFRVFVSTMFHDFYTSLHLIDSL